MSDATATVAHPMATIFLHGLVKRITAADVAVPLTHNEICAVLRANLSRRIATGSWNTETEED